MQILPRITTIAGFELGSGTYITTAVPEKSAAFIRNFKLHDPSGGRATSSGGKLAAVQPGMAELSAAPGASRSGGTAWTR
jgi:hypothetical protein